MRSQFLSWQSYTLSAICLADLTSTVWLCHAFDASEGNPLMAFFLAQGVCAFACAKIVMTAAPLAVLEWARRIRPKLGAIALNTSVLGYLAVYGAGLAHVNGGQITAEAARVASDNEAHVAYLENARRIAAKRASRPVHTVRTRIKSAIPSAPPSVFDPRTSDIVPFPPPG